MVCGMQHNFVRNTRMNSSDVSKKRLSNYTIHEHHLPLGFADLSLASLT